MAEDYFTAENKKEMGGKYFEIGQHDVIITKVEFGVTDKKQDYIDFHIQGQGDDAPEDKVRMFQTTTGAKTYTFNTIRAMFVHNSIEAKKESTRKAIDAITTREEMDKVCQKLVGKEAFFTVYESEDRTYQNEAGETKPSLEKNIYGYRPKPKTTTPKTVTPDAPKSDMTTNDNDGNPNDPFGF